MLMNLRKISVKILSFGTDDDNRKTKTSAQDYLSAPLSLPPFNTHSEV